MKYIPLSQGKFAIVDDEDYDYLMQWKWCVRIEGERCYASRTYLHRVNGQIRRQTIRMHRVIMRCPRNLQIDHINHNGLDNRKCNLRICTQRDNLRNMRPRKNCNSRYKGVSLGGKRWQARITIDYKSVHIGCYESEIEAARAYDEKAKELFGEYACVNLQEERDKYALFEGMA